MFYINLLITVTNLELSGSVMLIGSGCDSSMFWVVVFSSLPEFINLKGREDNLPVLVSWRGRKHIEAATTENWILMAN